MTEPSSRPETLPRVLGGPEAVTLVVGSIIGSGIFLVPKTVAQEVGSPGLALAVWAVVGLVALLSALTYAEVAAMLPRAGGMYVYLTEAYGGTWGYLRGWTELVLNRSGSTAILSVAFTLSAAQIVPLPPWSRAVLPVALIALLAAVNVAGTVRGGRVQNWTTFVRVAALAVMAALPFVTGKGSAANWTPLLPADPSPAAIPAFGAAMLACMWAYTGWAHVGCMAEELKAPQRTLPLGLILGVLTVVVLYLGVNVAYLSVLPVAELARSEHPAAALLQATAGDWGRNAIALLVMCSTFGGVNAALLIAPRTYFAMARDGVFFPGLAHVHPVYRTPARAIVLHAAWAAALVLGGGAVQQYFFRSTSLSALFSTLVSVVVFGAAVFETTALAAVFRLRKTRPEHPRPYRVPGYPWVPAAAIVAYLALLGSTLVQKPVHSGIGVLLIAAGLLFRRR